MNYVNLIEQLNQELFDKLGETDRKFTYATDGFVDIINFGEIHLWDSENSEQVWDENKKEYEPFKPFIIRTFNNLIDELNKYKY